MSLPHTGTLLAKIDGEEYSFDGDVWKGPSGDLLARLNRAAEAAWKHHLDIKSIALQIFRELRLDSRAVVTTFTADSWTSDLPDDAID